MNRERLEIGWYAVRPFLFYMVLFITVRAILYRLLESALLTASADMTLYYEVWSDLADILIIGYPDHRGLKRSSSDSDL